jgi:hypothetical protein
LGETATPKSDVRVSHQLNEKEDKVRCKSFQRSVRWFVLDNRRPFPLTYNASIEISLAGFASAGVSG